MKRLALFIAFAGVLLPGVAPVAASAEKSASALVEATEAAAEKASPEEHAAAAEGVKSVRQTPYRHRSDEELTALAADWDSLGRHERRELLTEMKLRMARGGERKSLIRIRTERRYGRLIRQPDGRVIHIETQVVHVRPLDPEEEATARRSFGLGFEQRVGRREQAGPAPRAGSTDPAPGSADLGGDARTLQDVLDALAPSTQAPPVNRLPVYQVSEPKP